MTTIAANLECMAADSRVSIEGVHYHSTKIFRIEDSLFGTAGDAMMSNVMLEWLRGKRNRKALYENWTDKTERSDCWLLELNSTGLYLWDGWGIPDKLLDSRYAIGTGAQVAIKGMDKGETPEEAVKLAINYDQYTGEPVQVEYLTHKKKK